MTFDPDHTHENCIKKEKEKMWDKLKEPHYDTDTLAINAIRDMLRDAFKNGDHKRKHNEEK